MARLPHPPPTPALTRAVREWSGWLVVAAGAVLCVLGWYGISGENTIEQQLPYLASATIPGAALIIAGAALIASRPEPANARIETLYTLLVADADTPAAPHPAPHPAPENSHELLAVPGGTLYHRRDCPLIAGKPTAEVIDEATVLERSLTPCPVCEPPTLPPAGPGPAGSAPDQPAADPSGSSPTKPGIDPRGSASDQLATGPASGAPDQSATGPASSASDQPATDPAGSALDQSATGPAGSAPDQPATDPAGSAPDQPATDPAGSAPDQPATDPAENTTVHPAISSATRSGGAASITSGSGAEPDQPAADPSGSGPTQPGEISTDPDQPPTTPAAS